MHSKFALRALSANGIAPTLADQIQALHESNIAIAKRQTIEQSKTLVNHHVSSLPKFLAVDLTDQDLTQLINQLIY